MGQQRLLSTADARCWCYVSQNGTTVTYSEKHCARGFLCPTMITIKPRLCPSSTFFAALAHLCRLGTQPGCRGCSASFCADGQAWPWTGPQLVQLTGLCSHYFSLSDEDITKAMKNPFYLPLAPHKPHFLYSAVNLQERTELLFPKNLQNNGKFAYFKIRENNLDKAPQQFKSFFIFLRENSAAH